MFMSWKNQYSKNDDTTQGIYRFNAIPIKLPMLFFTELEQIIHSLYGNTKNLKYPKLSGEGRMELEESTCLTSDYTKKQQSLRQYGIGTKTET